MPLEVIAGCSSVIGNYEAEKDPNEWMIIDIGFSIKNRSSGVWTATNGAKAVSFGDLVNLLSKEFQRREPADLNLVIEAPLSIAFQENGNPTMRTCDRVPGKSQPRPYFTNAGATTFIAAQMLFRELRHCEVRRTVRLFEGFLSFKSSNDESRPKGEASHIEDVLKIKEAIWTGRDCKIFAPEMLPQSSDHRMESAAFPFVDRNLIPPVIRINPDS